MPELITHCLVGEKIIAKMDDKNIKTLLQKYKHEFILGAQGGDIFFFYQFGVFKNKEHVPDFGDRLHTDHIEDFFKHGIKYVKAHSSDALLSYFLGYLSHYAADKQIHPFVNKKSDHSTTKHHNIEFMLGKQYLQDTTGEDAQEFDMEEPFDFVLSDDIINFYIHLASELYHQKLTKEQIKQSKKDFRDFKIKTQHPGIHYKIMAAIAKPIVKFNPMALTYKEKNDWQYFSEEDYAKFISNVCQSIDYAFSIIKTAYAFVKQDKPITDFLQNFDGTDFNGVKR